MASASYPPIGLERLSVFGMPPVPFVQLAAKLGCASIGLSLTPARGCNPHNYPDWSLRADPQLRHETRAALRGSGVSLALVEGFGVGHDVVLDNQQRDLDLLGNLDCARINVASRDRDAARGFDGFARLAEEAADRSIEVVIEIGPGPVPHLEAALAAVHHVGRANFRLLIDTMHFFRMGSTMAMLRKIDASLISYVQLCDAPLRPRFRSYLEEAFYERMGPGSGELPLTEFLAWLPPGPVISLEVPQRSLAQAGIGPAERLAPCVNAARRLLAIAT